MGYTAAGSATVLCSPSAVMRSSLTLTEILLEKEGTSCPPVAPAGHRVAIQIEKAAASGRNRQPGLRHRHIPFLNPHLDHQNQAEDLP